MDIEEGLQLACYRFLLSHIVTKWDRMCLLLQAIQ